MEEWGGFDASICSKPVRHFLSNTDCDRVARNCLLCDVNLVMLPSRPAGEGVHTINSSYFAFHRKRWSVLIMDNDEKKAFAVETPFVAPVTRRNFVKGASVLTGAAVAGIPALASEGKIDSSAPIKELPLKISINGRSLELMVDPRISLLDLLREQLKMTGTKKGCDHGQCGACTVLASGRRINSCLSLALVHDNDEITTIEGLASGDNLHPVQQAFLDHDGYQCGYCTPGQIASAVGLLSEAKAGQASFVTADLTKVGPIELTTSEIQERMSGNICRCGAYPGIVAAVRQAYRG